MPRPGVFIIALIAAVLPCTGRARPAFYPDFMALSAPLFSEQADIPACRTGRLRAEVIQQAVDTLNDIRDRHGLAPVELDRQSAADASQAALMLAANGKLAHAPPPSWLCYSAAGAKALASSLLSGGVSAPNIAFHTPMQDIIAWLIDSKAMAADSIGHRRWLLDPFVSTVSYGRVAGRTGWRKVSGGSVLHFAVAASSPASGPELIAYPYRDYPARYFSGDALLSLSLLVDAQRRQGNAAVDFSAAEIHVVSEHGEPLRIRDIASDNHYFGLPNNLQFRTARIQPGVRYEVSIDGVRVRGVEKSYRYWFRIIPE